LHYPSEAVQKQKKEPRGKRQEKDRKRELKNWKNTRRGLARQWPSLLNWMRLYIRIFLEE
jgi:hypothetical protein